MEVDTVAFDETDRTRIKAKDIELTIDEPKPENNLQRVKIYHSKSIGEKTLLWLQIIVLTYSFIMSTLFGYTKVSEIFDNQRNLTVYK